MKGYQGLRRYEGRTSRSPPSSSVRRISARSPPARQGSDNQVEVATMPLTFAITGPRARRSRLAGARLFAHALAGLLLAAHGARAEYLARPVASSIWVCSDQKTAQEARPPLELEMKDGLLIEQPLGSPRYRMLTDNEFAIIAVDDYAGYEP